MPKFRERAKRRPKNNYGYTYCIHLARTASRRLLQDGDARIDEACDLVRATAGGRYRIMKNYMRGYMVETKIFLERESDATMLIMCYRDLIWRYYRLIED